MDGTTKEQDKIRRGTLLISLLLLVCSLGSYFVYQHFYQPELHVSFVSKKILPNTGSVKDPEDKTAKNVNNYSAGRKSQPNSTLEKELEIDPINSLIDKENLEKTVPRSSSSKVFKLSDEIESSY